MAVSNGQWESLKSGNKIKPTADGEDLRLIQKTRRQDDDHTLFDHYKCYVGLNSDQHSNTENECVSASECQTDSNRNWCENISGY